MIATAYRGVTMEYMILAGSFFADIFDGITLNPWVIGGIAAGLVFIYFITTRA